jgi:hypothetical protein
LELGKSNERTRLQGAKPRLYVLSSIFKCAECGAPLVGQSYHGHGGVYRYYGHTTKGAKNGCKVQRVSADEIENAVIKYLKGTLVDSSYFKKLQAKLKQFTDRSATDYSDQIKHAQAELSMLEQEATNIFRMQAQGNFGSDVLKMMSDRLELIAKQKNQYTESLKMFESKQNDVFDAAESAQFIRESIVEFEKGFDKAPMGLKKRLVRNTIKQIVLAHDKLAFWFFKDADEKGSGERHLKLVRDEQSEVGVSLVSGDNFSVSNLSVQGLVSGKFGDPCFPLTKRFQSIDFIHLHLPSASRVSSEITKLYQEGLSLREVAREVGIGKTLVRRQLLKQGVELRPKVSLPTATMWRKSGKAAVRPYYGFCFAHGRITRDSKEFSILLLIHEKWKQGVNSNAIATYLNSNKIPSRCNKTWSWNAVKNIADRFENKKIIIKRGGKYEFR